MYDNLLILLDLKIDVKSKTHLVASNKTNFLWIHFSVFAS